MYKGKSITLIMPARDEALALPSVLGNVPREVDRLLLVNNGSKDNTADVARRLGAQVVDEPIAGYGRACLAGLRVLEKDPPDIVAFADADGSDDMSSLLGLVDSLIDAEADFVLGKRVPEEPGALSQQQLFGNWLAVFLINQFWGHKYGDLGPMRVIRWDSLKKLEMNDTNYGWTVQMQIRALRKGLKVREYPIPYKRRIAGVSKVSRTLSGSVRAGVKIIWVICRELLSATPRNA